MAALDLHESELYGRSPWLRFLYDTLGKRVTVAGACFLWALLQTGFFIALGWRQDTLLPTRSSDVIPLLKDTTFLGYFLLLPLCFGLLYYSLILFCRYVNRLDEVLEPAMARDSKSELLAQARDEAASSRWSRVRWMLMAIGFLVFLYNALINLDPQRFYAATDKWDSIDYPLSYVLARIYVFLVWVYLLPMWASYVYLQLRIMDRLSRTMVERRWLRVSPYAADGFGGLGSLAQSAAWVGYLIFAGSLLFLSPFARRAVYGASLHVGNYVGLVAYVILAFIGIFTPVYILHRSLAAKRQEMLDFLVGAFDQVNLRISRLVSENNIEGLADETFSRTLESIDRLYAQWSSLQSWPVSYATVIKFVATVVIPAVGYVVVQQLLKGTWE